MGIELLDHIVIGNGQYITLKEKGYFCKPPRLTGGVFSSNILLGFQMTDPVVSENSIGLRRPPIVILE
jgi:hypothetical protein